MEEVYIKLTRIEIFIKVSLIVAIIIQVYYFFILIIQTMSLPET